jgi:hypothetical protein
VQIDILFSHHNSSILIMVFLDILKFPFFIKLTLLRKEGILCIIDLFRWE